MAPRSTTPLISTASASGDPDRGKARTSAAGTPAGSSWSRKRRPARAGGLRHVERDGRGHCQRGYFASTFENHGFHRHYDVTVSGRTWTISGATERATKLARLTHVGAAVHVPL